MKTCEHCNCEKSAESNYQPGVVELLLFAFFAFGILGTLANAMIYFYTGIDLVHKYLHPLFGGN